MFPCKTQTASVTKQHDSCSLGETDSVTERGWRLSLILDVWLKWPNGLTLVYLG